MSCTRVNCTFKAGWLKATNGGEEYSNAKSIDYSISISLKKNAVSLANDITIVRFYRWSHSMGDHFFLSTCFHQISLHFIAFSSNLAVRSGTTRSIECTTQAQNVEWAMSPVRHEILYNYATACLNARLMHGMQVVCLVICFGIHQTRTYSRHSQHCNKTCWIKANEFYHRHMPHTNAYDNVFSVLGFFWLLG